MQEREEFDYLWLGARQLGHTEPIFTDAGPVPSTVDPGPIQGELISNDVHEVLVNHSLCMANAEAQSPPLQSSVVTFPAMGALFMIKSRSRQGYA